jgi:hypothetical protein
MKVTVTITGQYDIPDDYRDRGYETATSFTEALEIDAEAIRDGSYGTFEIIELLKDITITLALGDNPASPISIKHCVM